LRARQGEAEGDWALCHRAQAPVNQTLELSNLPATPRLDRQNRRLASRRERCDSVCLYVLCPRVEHT